MTVNNHPEPQPLSQDTDEQSTVAAPDEFQPHGNRTG